MVRDQTKDWIDRFTELVANDKELHDATVNLLNAIAKHEEAKAMKIKARLELVV